MEVNIELGQSEAVAGPTRVGVESRSRLGHDRVEFFDARVVDDKSRARSSTIKRSQSQ